MINLDCMIVLGVLIIFQALDIISIRQIRKILEDEDKK